MLSVRHIPAIILGSSLFVGGCIAEPLDQHEEIAEAEEQIIIYNGLDPDFFWLPDVFGTVIWYSHHALTNGVGELPSSVLLNTVEGRDLLTHMIGCAMSPGTVIKNTVAGFSAEGSLGLAPAWKTVPLDWVYGQRAVTACLLQSLNAFDVPVPVNMTGYPVPESQEDTSSFDFSDMIAFGNLFSSTPKVYACYLKPLEKACGANTSVYAKQRICDTSPTCQLTLLGSCTAGVCETDEKGNSKCTSPSNEIYGEAIMTALQTDNVRRLYPECSP